MTYSQVITNNGKYNLLLTGFTSGAFPFSLMAAGKGTINTYDPTTNALINECTSADGNYSQAAITITQTANAIMSIDIEAIFDTTNITNATTITEVGIVNSEGQFFCLCQLPAMDKTSSNQLRVVVTVAFE